MALPEGASAGKVRLYEDGVFPDPSGRARFVATEHRITAESPSARYPLHLNTGRLRDQWHGMSRTGLVARLYSHESNPCCTCTRTTWRGGSWPTATWSR
jgi:assimilatory nitrate reductase catalytic subunit